MVLYNFHELDCELFTPLEREIMKKTPLIYEAIRIRRIEERIIELYPSDVIQSPLHLSIGQESLAVGVCAGLNDRDQLFTTYRSHAYYLAKGGDIRKFMAELMGKESGCCSGKGGSMHLADATVNFMGTSAIVASTIPHAVGAAYSNKLRGNDNLVVCVFGDGAADAGIYHESINFASLHELPIIFVIEDNGLAVHTSIEERQAFNLVEHAGSYNLKTFVLDQTHSPDIVSKFMSDVYSYVKLEKKPAWVKLKTFRYKEHVGVNEDFLAGYRNKDDFDEWYSQDPIVNFDLTQNIEESLVAEINDAVKFGLESSFPVLQDLYKDVN
jgi:TPP-dependent pyruvate/acetoin dehydrogenase alpha subunit